MFLPSDHIIPVSFFQFHPWAVQRIASWRHTMQLMYSTAYNVIKSSLFASRLILLFQNWGCCVRDCEKTFCQEYSIFLCIFQLKMLIFRCGRISLTASFNISLFSLMNSHLWKGVRLYVRTYALACTYTFHIHLIVYADIYISNVNTYYIIKR